MHINVTKKIKLNAVQVLALGFFIVILTGAILLSLPISSQNGQSTDFIDSLFTATTSVCVTGLVTVDTGTHWNYFGQVIIMILIEVGGLGFMSFTTLIAILIGKKITLKERLLMQEALNTFNIQGMVRMVRYVLAFTFLVQILGALLYSTQFIPIFGLGKGIYYSIFHSISAFNNAGIDLFGHFQSLTNYSSNAVIILTTSALIIIGGLGFTVWAEIYNYKGFKKLSLHSKIVIMITSILIIGGTILFFFFEYKNPNTLGPMGFGDKVLNSFFASVTPRTAGFNSIPTDGMSTAGIFLTTLLMFIGGSPGSTAGGLKTVTFGILILTFISIIKGRDETEIFYKRIPRDAVRKSIALFIIAMGLIIVVSMTLCVTEVGATFQQIIYEVTSAFATVGLTLGLTTKLTTIGKILIIITMYCGRVGPMTVALALTNKRGNNNIKYPEERILVG